MKGWEASKREDPKSFSCGCLILYADTDFFFSLLFFCFLLLFCFFGPKSQISSFSERQIQFFDFLFFSFFFPQKLLCGCSLSCADKPLLDVRYFFLHFAPF